jgi:periplasmic copper chaperone A
MRRSFFTCAFVAAACSNAAAHVTLESNQAPVGAPYKAVLRVSHGCEGAATTVIRVKIPDGMIAVKPMPKPGWAVDVTTGKYAKSYSHFHGVTLSQGATEIAWSGGKLADAHYDEFVFSGFLAGDLEPGRTLYFPVVQECEKGVHRWIEIPAADKSSEHLAEPAPGLKLLPKK